LEQSGVILAPPDFFKLSQKVIDSYSCGPGEIGDWLVPDTLWGQNVIEACQVHDFMCRKGGALEDKKFTDMLFLFNMISIIEDEKDFFDEMSLYRAITYYIAVSRGGERWWNFNEGEEK
jgi:hypothetical protein